MNRQVARSYSSIPGRRPAGFSLPELIIFLAALVVLITIAAPRLLRTIQRDRAPAVLEVLDSVPAQVTSGSAHTFAVQVRDGRGEPVERRRVEFLSSASADSIDPARPHTDSTGVARVTWRMGPDAGERTLRVVVVGTNLEQQFATHAAEERGVVPEESAEAPEAEITPLR